MKYQLKNKIRFIMMLSFTVLTVISIYGYKTINFRNPDDFHTYYKVVTIETGDTLVNIADKYNVTNKKTWTYVNEIRKFNNMSTLDLYAGDSIVVPVTTYKTSVAVR